MQDARIQDAGGLEDFSLNLILKPEITRNFFLKFYLEEELYYGNSKN